MFTTVETPEVAVRILIGVVVFAVLAAWEIAVPRRHRETPRRRRWTANLGLLLLNTLLVRLLIPAAAVGAALMAEHRSWGMLNTVLLPTPLAWALSLLLLDLLTYLQHRVFHAVPWLWRLHRVHHADLEFDVSTGLRFHPGEVLLSVGVRMAAVVAIGAPPLAVLAFEVLLNATSMFNHSNVTIPKAVDRVLRWWMVTPDMHRIHHSVRPEETDSNFGFNLTWWDRWFATYRREPADGHTGMRIGLETFRSPQDLTFWRLLAQPFR